MGWSHICWLRFCSPRNLKVKAYVDSRQCSSCSSYPSTVYVLDYILAGKGARVERRHVRRKNNK